MASLVIRRLLVDLEQPFDRRWNGGDAFRSAFFNALSLSFPIGEQFFIDSVREGVAALPAGERERFEEEVRGFIGQEATHRHLHALYNRHLAAQGYDNAWERRIARRLERLEGVNVRHRVGITAATEHFTAMLAAHQHAVPAVLAGADPRLALLWQWHASEETEHRSTAFDLYRALGGNERWRRRWFRIVSFHFACDVMRQTASILRRDGRLWRWHTWRSGAAFLFGRDGFVRRGFAFWRSYLREDFHPSQHDGSASVRWLAEHASQWRAVGGGTSPGAPRSA